MSPKTVSVPVPQGPLGLALQEEEPIVVGLDTYSPLKRADIQEGFKLIAIKLGNGVVLENMTTKEVIDALEENFLDSRRKIVFEMGYHSVNQTTSGKPDKPSLEYWKTDLVAWFQYYDADGSGALSQREVIDAMVDTFSVPQNRRKIVDVVKKYWHTNDFDGSGHIELDEFCDPDGFGEQLRKVIHMHLIKDIPEKPSLTYWENHMKLWFHYYDIDASGHLSKKEIIDGLVDTFAAPQSREKIAALVEKYWNNHDFDENGLISLKEFCDEHGFGNIIRDVIHSAIKKRSKKEMKANPKPTMEYFEKHFWEWFDYYDQDKNGFLSQQEVVDGFVETFDVPQNRSKITTTIKKYWERNDFDKDGFVSKREFCNGKGLGWKLKRVMQQKLGKMTNQKKTFDTASPATWQNNLEGWFEHYDTDNSGTLSMSEVVVGLIETFSVTEVEEKKTVKETVMDTWFLFDFDSNQVIDKEEFLTPNGFAQTLKVELKAKVPTGGRRFR
mmetsp:Transcript_11521/g.17693  ORF Transcript_11521/g.17693 Transcript_11521/m.17693 type:complete len:498 (+) Transcript_11521:64-1557(+)